MNFDDSPGEAEFRRAAREWLEANAKPKPEHDANAKPKPEHDANVKPRYAEQRPAADPAIQVDECKRWQRTSGQSRIGGGTDQIQRNIIGERVLGFPAEPRVDKQIPFNQLGRDPGARG